MCRRRLTAAARRQNRARGSLSALRRDGLRGLEWSGRKALSVDATTVLSVIALRLPDLKMEPGSDRTVRSAHTVTVVGLSETGRRLRGAAACERRMSRRRSKCSSSSSSSSSSSRSMEHSEAALAARPPEVLRAYLSRGHWRAEMGGRETTNGALSETTCEQERKDEVSAIEKRGLEAANRNPQPRATEGRPSSSQLGRGVPLISPSMPAARSHSWGCNSNYRYDLP